MSPELSLEIRDQLRKYLDDKISLRAFQDWFVPATWDATEDSEEDRLAAEVEHWLAEYTSGVLPEEKLKERFHASLKAPLRLVLSFTTVTRRIDVGGSESPTVWVGTVPAGGS